MVNNQKKVNHENLIKCCACGKLLAKGQILHGQIKLPCKCGVMNTIGAEMKPEGRSNILPDRPSVVSLCSMKMR